MLSFLICKNEDGNKTCLKDFLGGLNYTLKCLTHKWCSAKIVSTIVSDSIVAAVIIIKSSFFPSFQQHFP